MKKLKIWNGRFYFTGTSRTSHVYAAAYSIKDLQAMLDPISRWPITYREISVYWSKGCWGNSMEGITPERGAWVSIEGAPIKRVI